MKLQKISGLLAIAFLLTSCATSRYGSFVSSTYITDQENVEHVLLGEVNGTSQQTWLLYIFPVGEAPSIHEAIRDAKSQIEGTRYLTDVSIENQVEWKFGYSLDVITVQAAAYK